VLRLAGVGAQELLLLLLGVDSSSTSISQLVAACGPVLPLRDGGLLQVLAQQQVLAPLAAAAAAASCNAQQPTTSLCEQREEGGVAGAAVPRTGLFVASWLLQLTQANQQLMLKLRDWYPLLSHLQQLVVVCSSWLPQEVISVLLRGGVAAVVTATPITAPGVEKLAGNVLADFFCAFYRGLLHRGLDINHALRNAAEAVPEAAGLYHCYQLG
jgi:hypothetical protein